MPAQTRIADPAQQDKSVENEHEAENRTEPLTITRLDMHEG
jgi:hypothetical protein